MRGDENRVIDAYVTWLECNSGRFGARWTSSTSMPSGGTNGFTLRPRGLPHRLAWTLTRSTGNSSGGWRILSQASGTRGGTDICP